MKVSLARGYLLWSVFLWGGIQWQRVFPVEHSAYACQLIPRANDSLQLTTSRSKGRYERSIVPIRQTRRLDVLKSQS